MSRICSGGGGSTYVHTKRFTTRVGGGDAAVLLRKSESPSKDFSR